MWMLMNELSIKAKLALNRFLYDEEGDVNVVSIVVLIGIAIVLAVFFKDKVKGVLDTLFDAIDKNVDKVNKAV